MIGAWLNSYYRLRAFGPAGEPLPEQGWVEIHGGAHDGQHVDRSTTGWSGFMPRIKLPDPTTFKWAPADLKPTDTMTFTCSEYDLRKWRPCWAAAIELRYVPPNTPLD